MRPEVCDVYIWLPSEGVGGWYLMEYDTCDACRGQLAFLAPKDHHGPSLLVSHQCLAPDQEPSR